MLIGAKLAGWKTGYEFMPIYDLKKGEKAREVIEKISNNADSVLLIRVSTRTADFGNAVVLSVFADTALYQKMDLTPMLNAGFIGMEVIDLGPPIMCMHSPFEVSSKVDVYSAYLAYMAFIKS